MPASRSARAMILAPRSWPSRPGLATTTRIFWVVLGADMGRGRGILCPRTTAGPRRAPRASGCRRPTALRDLDGHLHGGRVDVAHDRVGAGLREPARGRALRLDLRDRALLRALRDPDVVRQLARPLELDGVAALDAQLLGTEVDLRPDLDGLGGREGGDGDGSRDGRDGHEQGDEALHANGKPPGRGRGL